MSGTSRRARLASDLPDAGRARDLREAALTLFADRGYRGTTVRDLARALQFESASLYHWIPSKQQILADLMIDAMEVGVRGQAEILVGADGPVEELRRLVDYHVRFHTRYLREAAIVNREIPHLDEADRAVVLEQRGTYEDRFQRTIDEGVRSGDFTVSSRRLATYAIVQMGIGIASWYSPEGPMSVEQISAEYVSYAMLLVQARVPYPGLSSDGPEPRAPVTARRRTRR